MTRLFWAVLLGLSPLAGAMLGNRIDVWRNRRSLEEPWLPAERRRWRP